MVNGLHSYFNTLATRRFFQFLNVIFNSPIFLSVFVVAGRTIDHIIKSPKIYSVLYRIQTADLCHPNTITTKPDCRNVTCTTVPSSTALFSVLRFTFRAATFVCMNLVNCLHLVVKNVMSSAKHNFLQNTAKVHKNLSQNPAFHTIQHLTMHSDKRQNTTTLPITENVKKKKDKHFLLEIEQNLSQSKIRRR